MMHSPIARNTRRRKGVIILVRFPRQLVSTVSLVTRAMARTMPTKMTCEKKKEKDFFLILVRFLNVTGESKRHFPLGFDQIEYTLILIILVHPR